MTTDWQPNAPDVKHEFNRQNQPPTRQPVTKQQIEALKAERKQPVLEAHLRPGGTLQSVADRQARASLELQINTKQRRLDRMRGRVKHDFRRSR